MLDLDETCSWSSKQLLTDKSEALSPHVELSRHTKPNRIRLSQHKALTVLVLYNIFIYCLFCMLFVKYKLYYK